MNPIKLVTSCVCTCSSNKDPCFICLRIENVLIKLGRFQDEIVDGPYHENWNTLYWINMIEGTEAYTC